MRARYIIKDTCKVPVKKLYEILLKASKKSRLKWLEDKKVACLYWKNTYGEDNEYWQNYLKEVSMFNLNCDDHMITDDGCKLLALRTSIGDMTHDGKNFEQFCETKGSLIKTAFNNNLNTVCDVVRESYDEEGRRWYSIMFVLDNIDFKIEYIGPVVQLLRYKVD